MQRRLGRAWSAAAVALPLAISAAVYASLLHGYFYADDFYNFARIADRGCARFAVEPMAGHVLLARNLVMCVHYGLFRLDASGYFAVVLATHLLNVWLLFLVIRRLTARRDAACIGATLWGASPLHAEALGWYAVYGHVLSALALLGALALALPQNGGDDRHPSAGIATLCGILLLLGATCFGTGLAIAVTVPIAIILIAPAARRGRVRDALLVTSLATPMLYLGLRALARWTGESTWLNDVALTNAAGQLGAVPLILIGLVRHALLGIVAGAWASRMPGAEALSWALLHGRRARDGDGARPGRRCDPALHRRHGPGRRRHLRGDRAGPRQLQRAAGRAGRDGNGAAVPLRRLGRADHVSGDGLRRAGAPAMGSMDRSGARRRDPGRCLGPVSPSSRHRPP